MTLTRLVSVERSLIGVGLGKIGGGKFETVSRELFQVHPLQSGAEKWNSSWQGNGGQG